MFPWGIGELEGHAGPDTWQADVLDGIGEALREGKITTYEAIRIAIASGHGIGKSTEVAIIVLWALSTGIDTMGIVTANTATQLSTKTWAQLARWHRLCLCGHWFKMTATAIYSRDPQREKTWRFDAIPWSENRTEAFAGLHNKGKRLVVIFDEASAIPDIIWETTEGALTDENTQIIWLAFGNPTRNTGRFRECFGRFRHRWINRQIDSRTSSLTNKVEIEQWISDYGEDSDFVRVRVKGTFPRAGSTQFIPVDVVEKAMAPERDPPVTIYDPFIMGVDVARYGDDRTVICFRRGRDARTLPAIKLRGLDTQQVALRVAEEWQKHHPDAIFIDGGGPGGGVVDRCRYMRLPVTEVQFGSSPDRSVQAQDGMISYANKRAEMWGSMREWLAYGMIPYDPELLSDLTGVEYGYRLLDGKDCIQLEKKEDMKKRGLASPDDADALALTFAYPVAPSDHRFQLQGARSPHQTDYDPFQDAWRKR